jgi:hypothetical protein
LVKSPLRASPTPHLRLPRSPRRLASAGVMLAVTLLAAWLGACGGDSDGSPEPTVRHQRPEAVIAGTHLTRDGLYEVEFPQGWTVDADLASVENQFVDAFFSGEVDAGVQTNISVTCEEADTEVDLDAYVADKLFAVESLDGRSDIHTGEGPSVSGQPSRTIEYGIRLAGEQPKDVRRVDVVFVGGGCGWVVSLVSTPGAAEGARPFLDGFLDSFELLS